MARNLTWADEKSFRDPYCDNCAWVYASFAMIPGRGISREEARKAYREKVRAEFQRHECAKHPREQQTH
jgi:hypothetical protein